MHPAASRVAFALFLCVASRANAHDAAPEPGTVLRKIAFGSCNTPLVATPAWDAVLKIQPDAWLWLGDVVYADSPRPTGDTPEARARVVLDRQVDLYRRLHAIPAYKQLCDTVRVLGTWDDHDYGINDDGANFVGRAEAQGNFLDFYREPADSPRRRRPGIYASHRFGPPGRSVQIIVLDTRYFRSPLRSESRTTSVRTDGLRGNYLPSDNPADTILGDAQWKWLEATLRQPADLRLILSSIQVVSNDHRFEKWGNFPHERRRLLALIRATGAQGVVFLSGDRHTGELSQLDPAREPGGAAIDPGYPLFDITSSAVLRSRPTSFTEQQAGTNPRPVSYQNEINRHRVGSPLAYNHFGLLTLDWDAAGGPQLVMALHLDTGAEVLRHQVPLAALRRK